MVTGLLIESLIKGKSYKIGYKWAQKWAILCCKMLGMDIEIQGQIPQVQCIIMPNHRSYSDIFATLAQVGCSFVAKAELRSWPLIGYAADAAGTIFVKRSSMESRKQTLLDMKSRLDSGYSITIFPEGTTFKGPSIKELKPGTFRLAAENNFKVCPVAIEYEDSDAAWVGDDLFVPHFVRTFGKWKTRVKIRYGTPFHAEDGDFLVSDSTKWITQSLSELQAEFGKLSTKKD